MSVDARIIRAGDTVRIDNPLFVLRVGYPKCIESETEEVLAKMGEQLDSVLQLADLSPDCVNIYLASRGEVYQQAKRKIAREIAYSRLRLHGFGGCNRTVHTRELPGFKGLECCVGHVRYAKTGVYYAPSVSQDYEYGYDYEPGGLDNQQTHKLLTLYPGGWVAVPEDWGNRDFEIEACHVTKVGLDDA